MQEPYDRNNNSRRRKSSPVKRHSSPNRRKKVKADPQASSRSVRFMGITTKTHTEYTHALHSLYQLPRWVLWWFYTTAIVCTWDASFIFLRPHTLPGGSLFKFWSPYVHYIAVDQRYKDVNDPFVFGISLFNYLEVILNVITIVMHYRRSRHTIPLAFTVTVMTFWKTLFYFYGFSEMGGGGPYRKGNSTMQEFLLVAIPNGIWVLLPFLVMVVLWERIVPAQRPVVAGMSSATNGSVEDPDRYDRNGSTTRQHVKHA